MERHCAQDHGTPSYESGLKVELTDTKPNPYFIEAIVHQISNLATLNKSSRECTEKINSIITNKNTALLLILYYIHNLHKTITSFSLSFVCILDFITHTHTHTHIHTHTHTHNISLILFFF